MKRLIYLLVMFTLLTVLIACTNDSATNENEEVESEQEETGGETDSDGPIEPIEPEELGSGDVKWEEIETAYGYSLVTNEDGETLGSSNESSVELIQVDGFAFKDLNKNNLLDAYEDWRLETDVRAQNLATLLPEEDIAGMMLYSGHQRDLSENLTEEQITFLDGGLRAVLNAAPSVSAEDTAKWNNAMQAYVEGIGLGVPVNTSTDPRDEGISVWPSNLGLAATFDTAIASESAATVSEEYRHLGITTLLGPQIDLSSEPRWSRIVGTFGEDPALSRDLTQAYVNAVQSTYDESDSDLGWGENSLNAMIKHWPGDGAGDSGRESHSETGEYTVYPGGQFETHLIPFVDGGFDLEGETGSASSIMTSYSIAWSEDGSLGEFQGTSFSDYKMDLLREKYGFDGVITTDWRVVLDPPPEGEGQPHGVEDLTIAERHYVALMLGVDQFGGVNDPVPLLEAYQMGVEEHGEEVMRAQFEESAVRLLKGYFRTGLFENPYVDVAQASEVVANDEYVQAGYEAQLKSVVMLKNSNNTIQAAEGSEKPTVYIPMIFRPASESRSGVTPASWTLPVEIKEAEQFYNVVTDTVSEELTGPEDEEGNPTVTVDDIIRASSTEIADVDYALAIVDSPSNVNARGGTNEETGEFIPLSVQYGTYTADSESVRKESISGDMVEEVVEDTYGAQTVEEKENRSYFGKEAMIINSTDLDSILAAGTNVAEDVPVIAAIRAENPMVLSEFENEVDAIIMGFGISDSALMEVASGNYEPSGLLPIQMPESMETIEAQFEDVPRDMETYVDSEGNNYDFAFGLNYSGVIQDERTEQYGIPALVTPDNTGN
ncbi:glycoside hydrolase family 3 protein [Paraliobacillus zengyii]|nr:glycoside hydrolase family 3 N-terminal domain-containing protein [Paraliobacillus zengyii]